MTPTTRRTIAVALATLATLAACSSGSDAESTTTTASPSTTSTTTPRPTTTIARTTTTSSSSSTSTTTTLPEVLRMPLTGDPVSSADEIPDRPALVVKIDNHPVARPQAGLNNADIVIEEIVEGQLTRFAAVFHSVDADPVGPIRSGRSQDVDMLGPLNGPVFAWSGGNAGVRNLIRNSDFINLDAGFTPGYYRRSGRGGAPHNLYSSTEALWLNVPADKMVAPPGIFAYLRPEETFTGEAATTIDLPMAGILVRWEWDADDGVYRRFQNGNSHDAEGAGQVVADNIIVMGVEYHPSAVDRRSPEAQTLGSGPVYVFADGMMRVGVWIHLDRLNPYGFVAPDDSAIGVPPGRTFIELARNEENFVTWEA
ncbi:MAG TPA: DUF3048 domain-containing protein [Ilumatobacteraceae bacterium]|nr:DUF3048 domain-containing protein [Ilumatobacteraceae bacterium]